MEKGSVNLSNGDNISGVTNDTLVINPVSASDTASDYNVMVFDALQPWDTSANAALSFHPVPAITKEPANQAVCAAGDLASFSVTASGHGLTYQWRKGTTNLTNTGNISGVTSDTLTINAVAVEDEATNYNVVVTDTCGRAVTSADASLSISTDVIINTQPTDQTAYQGTPVSFSVTATGAGLTYQWRKGTVNLTNTGNIAGATSATLTVYSVSEADVASDYNVVVSNTCGTSVTSENASLNITGSGGITINTVDILDVEGCYGEATGEIQIDAVGGVAPLKYSIDGGSTWQTNNEFLGLNAGSYNIQVQDAEEAVVSYSNNPAVVEQPDELTITNVVSNDVTAYNADDGSIIITGSGGTTPLQYSIDDGNTWQANNTFDPLPPGEYNVKVKDDNDCMVVYNANPVIITQPNQVQIDDVASTNITGCFGDETGSIEITASQGQIPYQYSIDGGTTWQNANLFEDLGAGDYNVQVKDGNDYVVSYDANPVILTQPDDLTITDVAKTDVEGCYGDMSGEIYITASGGTGDIQYTIDGGTTWKDVGDFVGLDAGDYNVMVKDANDCQTAYDNNPITITQPDELGINSVDKTDVVGCYGEMTGEIQVDAAGGTGSIMYSIDNGDSWQEESVFDELIAGEYFIKVKDENECTTAHSDNPVILEQPEEIIINELNVTPISCYGADDAVIDFSSERWHR
ncbi:MAG: hypothetical protein U5L09_22110 [Bacteroidales bacterium]|nr:hypothetical protein [Bacteroidales bacterium]